MNENGMKMIEDIRAIIDDRCEAELGQVHAESKGGKVTKTVSTSLIAKDIYNANFRKVGEDEIVIKKREYEALLLEQKRLKEMVDRIPCGYELKEITRQETVKDIIDKIENLADIEIRGDTACEKYFDMVLDILDKEQ